MSDDTPSPLNNVITIERIKSHLDRVVRGTVEETLNALLDAEADRLCNAQRYERSAARRDTRAGHYERGLQTKAGEVRLRVPKLRRQTFAPGRGHHGGFVGHASVTLDGVGPEQEDLWDDRGLAQSSDRRRAPVGLSRRHGAQTQLGRRGGQHLTAGCDRRERARLSGDSRHLRGGEGG
jgi:hypothetical protein